MERRPRRPALDYIFVIVDIYYAPNMGGKCTR